MGEPFIIRKATRASREVAGGDSGCLFSSLHHDHDNQRREERGVKSVTSTDSPVKGRGR